MAVARHRSPLLSGSIGTVSIPTWAAAGALVGVTLGTLTLEATQRCLGIKLEFAETTGTIVSWSAQIRPLTRLAHIRSTLPLWTARGATVAHALLGGADNLEAGREYQVRISVTDDAANTQVVVGTVTTDADDIPTHAELIDAATHWVDPVNGDDAALGTSAGTAWKTLDKAWTAPSGAVVVFRPGDIARETSAYTNPPAQAGRTTPLTLVAEYPACDERGNVINEGRHSVIQPPAACRIAANIGAWAQVQVTGPGNTGAPAGAVYTVWFYASGLAGAQHLHWSETADGPLTRVAHWRRDAANLATAAGAIEKMFTNQSYTYGFYATATGDLYLRLPGDVNPNTRHWVIGEKQTPIMSQSMLRVCGLKLRGWPYGICLRRQTSIGSVIDRNWIDGAERGTYTHAGTYPDQPEHITFQGNRITDRGLKGVAGDDVTNSDLIPWSFIKSTIRNADGTTYATTSKIAAACETVAMGGKSWGRLTTVRRNVIDGPMNGIAQGGWAVADHWAIWVMDVSDNVIRNMLDDPFEPDGWASVQFIRDNRVENTLTVLSTGPVHYGPIYLLRNQVWRWGNAGVGLFPYETGVGSPAFKYSGSSSPLCKVYVYHNTFWSDDPSAEGGNEYSAPGDAEDVFELRGNILRTGHYAFLAADPTVWSEDGNLIATGDATKGLRMASTIYGANVGAYRTATSQGATTNVVDGTDQPFNDATWLDALLADPENGDLVLAGSHVVAKVPGASDQIAYPRIGYRPRA